MILMSLKTHFIYCRLKAYCNDFLGRKINLSGISPVKRSRSGQNSVYVDRSRVTTFRKFWGRSAHFAQKVRSPSFLCGNPDNLSGTSQRPIFNTKRSSVSRRGIRKVSFENFHFRGHLPPKSEIENRPNRHLTQSRLQVTL